MVHIEVRNVPPDLHEKLKERAADAGMSLSDYMLETFLRPLAEKPTESEFVARARQLAEEGVGDTSSAAE